MSISINVEGPGLILIKVNNTLQNKYLLINCCITGIIVTIKNDLVLKKILANKNYINVTKLKKYFTKKSEYKNLEDFEVSVFLLLVSYPMVFEHKV